MLERRDIPMGLILLAYGAIGVLWGERVIEQSDAEFFSYILVFLTAVWLNVSGRVEDGFGRRRRG
jgi:uncharacterized membrane protein YfcA